MSTLRAKTSFTAYVGEGSDAQSLSVAAGELIASDNVVVKGREAFFEKVEDVVLDVGRKTRVKRGEDQGRSEVLMERASADPGERRSVGRPKADDKSEVKPDESKDEKKGEPTTRTTRTTSTTGAKGKQDGEV